MIPSGDLNSLIQLRHLVSDAIDVSSSQFMANSKIKKISLQDKRNFLFGGLFGQLTISILVAFAND